MSDTTIGQWGTIAIAVLALTGTIVLSAIGHQTPAPLVAIDGALIGLFFTQHGTVRAIEAEHAAQLEQFKILQQRQVRATDPKPNPTPTLPPEAA